MKEMQTGFEKQKEIAVTNAVANATTALEDKLNAKYQNIVETEKKAAQKQIEDIKSKLTEEHQMEYDSFKRKYKQEMIRQIF